MIIDKPEIYPEILHLVIDSTFIDDAYRAFETIFPGSNTYKIITRSHSLKNVKCAPVEIVPPRTALRRSFIDSLKMYDIVILHYLDFFKIRLVANADSAVKFTWIGWGGDYYDLITTHGCKLLKKKTLQFSRKSIFNQFGTYTKNCIKCVIKNIIYGQAKKKSVLNRINYFSPVLYEDYESVKQSLKYFKPVYLSWNYGNLEDNYINGIEDVAISGNNILIGNSATITNNHFDVFDIIKKVNIHNRKVICPLSYGDKYYKHAVISEGKKLFHESFVPLLEYIPLSNYVNLLTTCSVVVMGHLRQQGLGNILTALHLGSKVFLDSKNPIYNHFKKEGLYVYTLEEFSTEYMIPLGSDMINHNRTILRKHWSRNIIHAKTKSLISLACFDV